MKKIVLLFAALALTLVLFASCGSGAPEGMKSVTVKGEPFILYVPEGFSDNTASGISSAYYKSIDNDLVITARHYTPADEAMTLDEYMTFCASNFAASLEGFEQTALAGDILYGVDARRLEYKMVNGEVEYYVIQRTAKHGGDFVTLNIYTTGAGLEVYADFIDLVVENFTLTEKSAEKPEPYVDKKTPEGMQIASSDIVEYRLYVPLGWVCDAESGVSEAHYPETERTNVTVTSYSPSASERGMTLAAYTEKCVAEYEKTINGFKIEPSDSKAYLVAGKEATSLEFSAEYDGVKYRVRQIIFYAPEFDLFYALTYTATEANYSMHTEDFEAMIGAFCFR